MQPLNAIDAIAPAFTRTHLTLFDPFKPGRSWKLAASSWVAYFGSMFVPLPLLLVFAPLPASARAVAGAIGLGFTLLMLLFFYFGVRMELVQFEMLVTHSKLISPMWAKYRQRVWPWMGLKIAVGTVLAAIAGAAFYLPIKHWIEMMAFVAPKTGANSSVSAELMAQMMGGIFAFYGGMLLFFLVVKTVATLLTDFVMPFYILEGLSVSAAVGRGFAVFSADPVGVLLYLAMKPILGTVGYMIHYAAMLALIIPLEIIGFAIGFGGFAVFGRHAGAGGMVLLVAGAAVLGLVVFSLILYASIGTFGYLLTLLEAYAIYFLAGRYPLLADLLGLGEGPGAPFTPPPVFPSREERQDDDGGPPMPMDPAVA